jgi:hypothetical protein
MMALRRVHATLPFALALVLYASVWLFGINLSGNPWTGFGWFFNPFAWQLIFFLGFAIGMGWIKPPSLGQRKLVIASALFVALAIPLSFWAFLNQFPALQAAHDMLLGGVEKTDLHPLRIVHFLCVAYLVLSLVAAWAIRFESAVSRHIIKVGQQSLASFLLSLVVARIAGVAFSMGATDIVGAALVNVIGLGLIVAGAHLVGWFKSSPWAGPGSKATITHQ